MSEACHIPSLLSRHSGRKLCLQLAAPRRGARLLRRPFRKAGLPRQPSQASGHARFTRISRTCCEGLGENLRASGPMAIANPFCFSTKYEDGETGLLYYGYRYLLDGRWVSRDPIAETGGYNVYGLALNDPLDKFDPDGRTTWCPYPYPGRYCSDPKPPPEPKPDSNGANAKRVRGSAYLWTCGCTSKKDRLSSIPGVLSPVRSPISSVGPGSGTYGISAFPTTPPFAVGGGGAGPCNILVVKCPDFVGVFHFTVGDSPSGTLGMFSWPSGCSAIICGGDDTAQSNCLGDAVKSAANAAGLNVVGVSGNSGCGVSADGKWWQHGN